MGDTVLVPAGARIFGKLSQADTQGNVGVDFTEIDLFDRSREKIEAIGTSTDMGPIQGNVYGRRNGRNFLIRALSGLGSTAMMVVENNVNGPYSESDMIRERAADNLGMATDRQLMQLNSERTFLFRCPQIPRSTLCGRSTRKEQTPAPRQKRTRHRRNSTAAIAPSPAFSAGLLLPSFAC